MKHTHFSLLVMIIASAFTSCNSANNKIEIQTKQAFNDSISVIKSGIARFELDSITSPLIQALQSYNSGDDSFLIYLNEEIGALYINDIITKRVVKSIKVRDGAEHHNKTYQGFYYHNKDSIFMYSFKPKVTLINEMGEVKQEYILTSNSSDKNERQSYLGIWSSTTAPSSHLYNDTLYINSVIVGGNRANRKVQILLNVKTGQTRLSNTLFPEQYGKYNFGDINYDIYSNCVNSSKNILVYSFPGYEKVIINQLNGNKVYEKSAQSKYISYFTEYNKSDYSDAISSPTLEYFMTSPLYGGVYYDKFRDLYYRLALLPIEQRNLNYEEKDSPLKQISVIVFDKDFNYLGEQKLEPNKYLMFSAFVSKDGFNIQNRNNSDETFDFTTFIVKPKQVENTLAKN